MRYSKEDIKFEELTPRAFENLCYDLVLKYGFQNLIWREGGADNGRDIEGIFLFSNAIISKEIKYFFECKHYTSGGVPPEHLNSKIAWADAGQPNTLVIITSSYLTNNARTWLEQISAQKSYGIVCIESENLKDRLLNYPELIERYFSQSKYEDMLKVIKDYKVKFNLNPSYELIKEIVQNISLQKLDFEDIGFILFSFYKQFYIFKSRNDFYGDFSTDLLTPLLEYLKSKVENQNISYFEEYKDKYDALGGYGLFDEIKFMEDENSFHDVQDYNFQYYELHLNYHDAKENWKIGEYLLIIFEDVAYEVFKVDKTQIRVINKFTPEKISEVSLNFGVNMNEKYKKYISKFST